MRSRCQKFVAALLIAPLLLAVRGDVRADEALEQRVKAAFLYNFAKFVAWPAGSFATEASPIVFCLVDHDEYADLIVATTKDRKVEGRSIEVRRLPSSDGFAGCHVLFTGEEHSAQLAVILQRVQSLAVLTVGEADDFLVQRGMIRLAIDEGKVRFDVSTSVAEAAGLKFSSQLLKLARQIER